MRQRSKARKEAWVLVLYLVEFSAGAKERLMSGCWNCEGSINVENRYMRETVHYSEGGGSDYARKKRGS